MSPSVQKAERPKIPRGFRVCILRVTLNNVPGQSSFTPRDRDVIVLENVRVFSVSNGQSVSVLVKN